MIKILELFGGVGAPRVALKNLGVPIKAMGIDKGETEIRSLFGGRV